MHRAAKCYFVGTRENETITGEISYDLVMKDEMSFVEGTYRVDGGDWQVVIASRSRVSGASVRESRWASGVAGVVIKLPRTERLNRDVVERLLSEFLGVTSWREVRGPD
jgi:hypothetical protein